MRVPLSLLKEYIPITTSIEVLTHRLTMSGFEVEEILEVQGETIFEVNVTPNRGDALSVIGMAREVSALFSVPLKKGSFQKTKQAGKKISIQHQATKACPRYSLTKIEGVVVKESPDWLKKDLELLGVRSINNVVDITNLILMKWGQPLHAFDAQKVRQVSIRYAREGEKIKTLDDREHALISSDLVIADTDPNNDRSIALAGIMGGKDSEVSLETQNILLECASFDPPTIRKTARRLGIKTESSYRFERGIDPCFDEALSEAIEKIISVCGGRVTGQVDSQKQKVKLKNIILNSEEVVRTLGYSQTPDIAKSLKKLGFGIKSKPKKSFQVTVPSYRQDIQRSIDLVEEVLRISGIEEVKETFPTMPAAPMSDKVLYSLMDGSSRDQLHEVKKSLVQLGLHETIHFSFVSPEDVRLLDVDSQLIHLANPLGLEFSVMRPDLMISLLKTAAHHQRHKINDIRLFEARSIFKKEVSKAPTTFEESIIEEKHIAGVLCGHKLGAHWSDSQKNKDIDFFEVKGIIQHLLEELRVTEYEMSTSPNPIAQLHPGQQQTLSQDGKAFGFFGAVHPEIASRFNLKKTCYVFDLNWDILSSLRKEVLKYRSFSKFPVVERDLAVVVDESVTAGEIEDFLMKQSSLIKTSKLFDLYRGQPVPEGKKSLAFSLQLGKDDQTLTEEEIQKTFSSVVEQVKLKFQGVLR